MELTQEEKERLNVIVKTDVWTLIERAIRIHTDALASISTIDPTLSGDAVKIEVLARNKAIQTINDALKSLADYGAHDKANTPLIRSMR